MNIFRVGFLGNTLFTVSWGFFLFVFFLFFCFFNSKINFIAKGILKLKFIFVEAERSSLSSLSSMSILQKQIINFSILSHYQINKFDKFANTLTCLIHQTISFRNIDWISKLARLFQKSNQNAWFCWSQTAVYFHKLAAT